MSKTSIKGLKINNTIIKRISGPVNFCLLKTIPGENLEDLKKSNINPPIVLLFGDIHHSNDNLCKKCDSESNCFSIQENSFLKLIDSLSDIKKLIIDFNVEHSFDLNPTEYDVNDVYPMSVLHYKILPCLRKEKSCYTKNIKWHYVDTRVTPKTKYYYENSFTNNFAVIHKLRESLFGKDKEDALYSMVETILNLCEPNQTVITQHKYINNLTNILKTLKYKNLDNLFEKSNINNSLIYKQIKKLNSPYNDVDFWKKNCNIFLSYIFTDIPQENIDGLKNLFDTILDISEIFFKNKDTYTREELLNSIFDAYYQELSEISMFLLLTKNVEEILLVISSTFLDLYYITRMLKVPYKSKNAELSIGYFGKNHLKNIQYFLMDILKIYEVINYEEIKYIKESPSRCLVFNEYIDLDSIIDESKK